MYQCKFGKNPSIGSEDNAQKPYFGYFKVLVKIRSRSLKSYQLLCLFQQCIYLSLVKIHLLNQKITHRNPISSFKSVSVTLKIRSKMSISNQHFPSYQQYIYVSLVKIHPLFQKITQGIHISDNSKCCCDLENKVKVTKI